MENGELIEILIIEFVISMIFIVLVIKVNRYVICGVQCIVYQINVGSGNVRFFVLLMIIEVIIDIISVMVGIICFVLKCGSISGIVNVSI